MSTSLHPHAPTLALATVIVCTILGSLLLCTWLQNRNNRALLYWGPADYLIAAGMALLGLRGAIPNFASVEVANACIIAASALNWSGARVFERRRPRLGWAVALPLAWILACQLPLLADSMPARIVLTALIGSALMLLTAFEFWRGRDEKLLSRWPAIAVLALQGGSLIVRAVIVGSGVVTLPSELAIVQSAWFGVVALVGLIYTITLAFIQLAMTKERTELLHKRAALIDPLTELLNRRAFLAQAETCLSHLQRARRPVAALAFDLDGFKQINDRFGHPVGDRALETFAAVARCELRGSDLIGRLGGEEFAALLPECGEAEALAAAERLRLAFAEATAGIGPIDLRATVSVGVAVLTSESDLAALLARADRAVYRAKAAGRNCVRVASPSDAGEAGTARAPAAAEMRAKPLAA